MSLALEFLDDGMFKVNKSVYIAKLGQRYNKSLIKFLLHVSNHVLRFMYMLNYVS